MWLLTKVVPAGITIPPSTVWSEDVVTCCFSLNPCIPVLVTHWSSKSAGAPMIAGSVPFELAFPVTLRISPRSGITERIAHKYIPVIVRFIVFDLLVEVLTISRYPRPPTPGEERRVPHRYAGLRLNRFRLVSAWRSRAASELFRDAPAWTAGRPQGTGPPLVTADRVACWRRRWPHPRLATRASQSG